MEKLKFNPNNKKYYSEDFIKGFECGVERQFNADMTENTAELQPIIREKWEEIDTIVDRTLYRCPNCGWMIFIAEYELCKYKFCSNCGAKMDSGVEE